ncbi:farnesyltransferase [Tribonema minus]|uniref:Farnesyltransferase n=1 Tax=Tribonema minus TaxID=303371 RepID=A0A835ZD72_9STRA|nr:farnesyltransferase [Tribonema minus]
MLPLLLSRRYLYSKKVVVDQALEASIMPVGPQNQKICESMKYSLMAGGKRVRPILCIAACEMFGGTDEDAMPTAVALEMIHSMSLIHDDLPAMDNDDLRRGKPTNHVVYGEAMAILAGDALLSKSFEHVAKFTKGVPAERVVEVLRRLGEAVGELGLAGGQAMDLELEGRDDTTLEDLRWIHRHKTGALLNVAVCAGAILGGASPKDVAAMETFSDAIGLAFQVADDILDCTQTTEQLGKTAGKDEAVSKTTYVKLMGMDGARAEARRLVDAALGALEPYGERAAALRALAMFIIEREN